MILKFIIINYCGPKTTEHHVFIYALIKRILTLIMVRHEGPTIILASIQTNMRTLKRSYNALPTKQHLHWLKTKEATHYIQEKR
jgi:hypothetical protein